MRILFAIGNRNAEDYLQGILDDRNKERILNEEEPKNYEFVGYDKDTSAFFENTDIRTIFNAKTIKYNYKFVLDDGKTIVLEKKEGIFLMIPS